MITEEIRGKIIPNLPKRYAKTIAEQTGYSEQHVYRVLHHKEPNDMISEALITLARETKANRQRLAKMAEQLSEDKAA